MFSTVLSMPITTRLRHRTMSAHQRFAYSSVVSTFSILRTSSGNFGLEAHPWRNPRTALRIPIGRADRLAEGSERRWTVGLAPRLAGAGRSRYDKQPPPTERSDRDGE